MLDIALLVPIQSRHSVWGDTDLRTHVAPSQLVVVRARDRLLEHLGAGVEVDGVAQTGAHRTLTAVALATSLERAGLAWHAIDPGWLPLGGWRNRLRELRTRQPRVVAISSTFVTDGFWISTLCALVRELLPEAKIVVGGYFYATDARFFLSLDADVLCVGEGEVRIVSITRAIRDGHPLDAIPGLYLRGKDGVVRYTGDVEPLALDDLPRPNWSLSKRMDPPIDPRHEPIDHQTETQRGCVFKCQFCTFRTLAAPVLGSTDWAVERILDAAADGVGTISLADATATYPRQRWRAILERLIERGGSAIPMSVYARISDLDDAIASLMARAGVKLVRIGQESGDQRMLNRMRKGTRVVDVRPAVDALGKHGIKAVMFMMHGFPGESEESIAATRRMLETVNDGHESAPVVGMVRIGLFDHQDLAGVHEQDELRGVGRYGWSELAITPGRAWEAAVETYLALSRIPHAPYTGLDAGGTLFRLYGATEANHYDPEFFRWAKAIDRGIGIFVEEELEGRRVPRAELALVLDRILRGIPGSLRRPSAARRALIAGRNRVSWRMMEEWSNERRNGVGPLTRVALALDVGRATGSLALAAAAARTGSYPTLGIVRAPNAAQARDEAAGQLVQLGRNTGRRRLSRVG